MDNKEEKVIPVSLVENGNNTLTGIPVGEDSKLEYIEQEKLNNQVNTVDPVKVDTLSPSQNANVSSIPQVQNYVPIQESVAVVEEDSKNNVGQSSPIVKNENNGGNSENNNNGPSTFGKIMTVLLFIFLFAFVYFLGDITDFINQKKQEKAIAEITSGRLVCDNTTETKTLDVKINAIFNFEDSKITSLTYTTTSTGDKIQDKEELQGLLDSCKILKEEVKSYDGVSIVCSLNNGIASVKQVFDYSKLEIADMNSAYAEAGGVYPQFSNGDDIDSVESKMISSDYVCEKIGN